LLAYFAFRRDPPTFLARMAAEYGDIVHLQVGGRHDYLLNHPDYIKQVLLATEGMSRSSAPSFRRAMGNGLLVSDGDVHQRNRKLVRPLFHNQHMAGWCSVIAEHAARTREHWQPGQTVDAAAEMLRLALAIIVRLLLSVDTEGAGRGLLSPIDTICKAGNQNTFPKLWDLLRKRSGPGSDALQNAIAQADLLLFRAITERRRQRSDANDMLTGLLRGGMTDQQIRDELMTLILAGHATIGSALAWSWSLLAQHPEARARLHQEVDAVLGDRLPTYEDFPRLTYTRSVLTETMRLYPPVWVFPRRPLKPCRIGDYVVPAGSFLQLSPYVTQRDARFFPDPDRFDPDRWCRSESHGRHRYVYFPFAAGTHRCIGEALAMAEGVLVLATIAQQWDLQLLPGHRVEPEAVITLRPRNGLPMTVHRRPRPHTGERPAAM
jgi:cytochrome P450